MAVSSKYTQDLSVQIVFFTLTCKWFLCFYLWAVIWSYIVDLFAALHDLASASSRTLLKLSSSVRALLKPYGDTIYHIWLRTLPFKALIAIFWDLQPLWPSSLRKANLLRFRYSSGHVVSKTKLVTPHFFYISDITNSSSFNGKNFRPKSMLANFRANFLN